MGLSFKEKQKIFLEKYKSPSGKTKYKRCINSTLRYAGGKSLAVGLIVELLPENIDSLVSPFFGGGAIEIACAKELDLPVIGYDIFDILINFWDVQINNPKELYRRLKKFVPTKDEYKRVKLVMKAHWDGTKKIRSKYDLAATYYFNHNTSYGPHFLGWPSSVYLQAARYKKMIEKVRDFDVNKNIKVECASFEDIMVKHRNDFLYLDPPYYLDGDSKTFIGMYPHRNFPIHHKGFKHELLRDLLKKHKGGFVLSYNDCSVTRDYYKEFEMSKPTWQYTFSQGDTRIGENRNKDNNGSYIKKSHELIFYSLPELRGSK